MVTVGVSGPDGAGKTTAAAGLAHRLKAEGVDVHLVYVYGCVACRRVAGPSSAVTPSAGRVRHRAVRRAHAVVDATELLVRLFLAARRRPAVLLTDRSPLDGLVKHASFAGPGTVAGRLYRLAARRYRRIALLDAPAAVLAARDREHDEQTLEQLRQRFREAAAELPNVKLVPSDIGTPELFGLVSDPI
jgi:thymidylate kinase